MADSLSYIKNKLFSKNKAGKSKRAFSGFHIIKIFQILLSD
ncbi:hypothetical protein SALWKB2_0627 [Snodgrassella alvi wkB2]|nr:hypothetical protein SALWKB2_0627 [Snodgrassella alvi wkB2]